MKRLTCLTFGVLLASMLVSCGTPAITAPTTTLAQATATIDQATATVEQITEETAAGEVTPEPVPFPLSEPGPYYAGKRTFTFQDASRDNRRIGITVWYPAVLPAGSTGTHLQVGTDRDPDLSGAPYPLILSSTKVARIFAPYLVTHGFAWASVDNIDVYIPWNTQLVDCL